MIRGHLILFRGLFRRVAYVCCALSAGLLLSQFRAVLNCDSRNVLVVSIKSKIVSLLAVLETTNPEN